MEEEKNIRIDRVKLVLKAILEFGAGIVVIGAIIFLTAGTLLYPNAWLFLIACVVPMIFALVFFAAKDPELLEKRMRNQEKRTSQKKLVKFSLAIEILAFLIPGLDFRLGWSQVPIWLSIAGYGIILCGFSLYYTSMHQNHYASRILEIQPGQKLIDNGLYSIVRHPMYASSILINLAIPLILGSFVMLLPMLVLCALLIPRIQDEEKMLRESLEGYEEYTQKVKYRLIPYVW
ncbi:MAG: isoprenylcysteine carboxylmethyltransferase family protein [Eubacteriaceae bacterium]|nr:isoprenylcysteine carboxylmethyltransferase family protein [Eubacteriaceae bacterium]